MSSKPTIVFVPGAWHTPECFKLVEMRLKSAGYQYFGVRTPSVRREPPYPKDGWEDVEAIRTTLNSAIGDCNDVVVVMHSYGGFPGSSACKGMSKEDRTKEGKKGGVIRLVYIASFAIPEGTNLSGGNGKTKGEQGLSDWCIVEGDYMRAERSDEIFYNDLPEQEAREWTSKLQYHATGSFFTPQAYSAFKFIPSTYVICELDNAVPAALQEMMATQPGTAMVIEKLKASHSPFLSMPEETSDIIRRAAGEF